jgi:hypothetical protein
VPALRTLARRAAIPVELDIRTDDRAEEPIEVAAYYVVSEALTNKGRSPPMAQPPSNSHGWSSCSR